MELTTALTSRRAYRSLMPISVTDEQIHALAEAASLAASCMNKQSWRFVFALGQSLTDVKQALNMPGNAWGHDASLIIGVYSEKSLDCVIKEREYFLFDTGMATAHMLLKGTELGLVMHPIAGFDGTIAKTALQIPEHATLITLIIAGAHGAADNPVLSDKQRESELTRPPRLMFDGFARIMR